MRLARGWVKASYSAAISGRKTGSAAVPDGVGQATRLQQEVLLLLADVGEVPDQRAHQRGVLAGQLRLVEGGQREGAPARGFQVRQRLHAGGGCGRRAQLSSGAVRQASGPSRRARSRTRSAGVRPESSSTAHSSTAGTQRVGHGRQGGFDEPARCLPRAARRRCRAGRRRRCGGRSVPLASAARSAATGSSSTATVSAASPGHQRAGTASSIRSSRKPAQPQRREKGRGVQVEIGQGRPPVAEHAVAGEPADERDPLAHRGLAGRWPGRAAA